MTLNELSIQFDILYNNISSGQAPGLTEYEKSVFLTQAQEAVILDLYKGTAGDSFESTEEVTRYLSSLVKHKEVNITTNTNNTFTSFKSYIADITDTTNPVWFITYQSGQIKKNDTNRDVLIVPIKQDDLYKVMQNPFKRPNDNKVLCISEDNKIVLYSKYDLTKYYIKYLKRPSDIDLESSSKLEVPESLHTQILLRAVQIAKTVWAS